MYYMSNAIHFLNTGHSDCIIIESNNHFAMIDAGEDTEYPADKPWLKLEGYEQEVCDYLLKNCNNSNGEVVLDFVLATHCHSDHIGGFDTVINHPNVKIKRAFLKPYYEENIFIMERKRWDNVEVYQQMKNALELKNVPIIESFEELSFLFGDMKITFFNSEYKKPALKFGENVNSVVTLVEYNGYKALLAGDMNYKNGGEKSIANKVGKIDLLKVGHHGYTGSTSLYWVKKLMPEYSVICNDGKRVYPDVDFKLKRIAKSQVICTVDANGVKFLLDDKLDYITNIM